MSEDICHTTWIFRIRMITLNSYHGNLGLALESKLAACRNFAKDQASRKSYISGNVGSAVMSSSGTKYPHPGHTSFFDKG
ncbi:hypothetical protein DV515_00014542 [Chloebia gouldiae]|uniref:Uncharacterized protein n=1 Tax=Chloebia gouldiae TaxID=44316 RepID=A0A3L8RY34_CHLGU|nr:hypothetical protein DV515_00014542 [Chloebia gouldiae]